jgi:general secretion pathway protein M
VPLQPMNAVQSRRLAVLLLVVALAAIVAVIAIPTYLAHRHYDNALAEFSDRLARYQRIASTRPMVARQLEAMRAKDTRRLFLRSGTTAISAAEAQEALRGIIEQNGGKLITMQAPTSRDDGRYRQITVSVQMAANAVALRRILNAIDTHTPFLFVDNLMVRTQVQSNFRPAPGAEPEMFVTLDVTGVAQIGT